MTAPQPGDRVRVTYEGVWDSDAASDGYSLGFVRDDSGKSLTRSVPIGATVKVLPKPVYVNHDTTEACEGDVVRNGHGNIYVLGFRAADPRGIEPIWRDLAGAEWWTSQLRPPLTLLVREGQVIA